MLPSEEEKTRIQEAQMVNPDIPLGTAEQFLLTLSSISELSSRLKLWAFKLDYEQMEKVMIPLLFHEHIYFFSESQLRWCRPNRFIDFVILWQEIAEPLMDLKQGLNDLKQNKTFRVILSTLRSIGNFLNGKQV